MSKFENIIKKYITEQIGANQVATNINPANFKNVNIAPNMELKKVADVLSKLLPQLNKDINSINLTDENSVSTFLDTLSKQNPDIYSKIVNQLKHVGILEQIDCSEQPEYIAHALGGSSSQSARPI